MQTKTAIKFYSKHLKSKFIFHSSAKKKEIVLRPATSLLQNNSRSCHKNNHHCIPTREVL